MKWLLLLLMIPGVALADIVMYDQGGWALGASAVTFRLDFSFGDAVETFYWRISIPDPSVTWGGFQQDIASIAMTFSQDPVMYQDQAYDNYVVRWYRWDDVPVGTLTVEYEASFSPDPRVISVKSA